MLFLSISFRTVTLWRNIRTPPSTSTMLVISGFTTVTAAVVAGISASMEPSAALLELLTVHSTCKQAETTIFTVTATLKVTAITFRKERCEWDSRLESASQDKSLLTRTLVGIQWIVSSLKKYQKLSSKLESCDHPDLENYYQICISTVKNKEVQKHWHLNVFTYLLDAPKSYWQTIIN